MDDGDDPPLDISEFVCVSAGKSAIVVVFTQTGRRYRFEWLSGPSVLSNPLVEGGCGEHKPEVLDCLARAVAYKAAQDRLPLDERDDMAGYRSRAVELRSLLSSAGRERKSWLSRR